MRRQLTIVASILAGCLIIGLLFSRVTVSQVAPSALQTGRYQVVIGVDSLPQGPRLIVVCDSTSGQCWTYATNRPVWHDLGIPATEVAKKAE